MACRPVLPRPGKYLFSTVCCALAVALPGTGHSQQQWDSYGGSPSGCHFSPLAQLTPANVTELELAWEHRSGDYRPAREGAQGRTYGDADGPRPQSALQVTPIVVGNTLYYCCLLYTSPSPRD